MPKYVEELAKLYAQQSEISKDPYLHAHSRNFAVIRRQVSIFERCQEVFNGAHSVLDWGCRHAADACMVRMLAGPGVELHGCDVDDPAYSAFFDFAGLKYAKLEHTYLLPYEDNSFDVVIGSGVLEHVANDSESLKELYRVIRPGGHFMMTMLPNRYSYTEWLNRHLKNPSHMRLYSLNEAKHMFMHHGFRPMVFGYHQLVPSLSSSKGGIFDSPYANKFVEWAFGFNSFLERVWPINRLSTNIFVIGKKELAFHG
jgi:SAM-dependent methyltransferase